ncbi:MAG: thiol reductant ABC exporter subunit CydC [Dehalococcoidia bacterium]|nr:thiol reductant ABC exporter subunit CydC [Dehalococcoidia bacterium]
MFRALFKQSAISAESQTRWMRAYLQRYKGLLFLVLFLGLLTYLCAAGLMFVSGYLVSEAATLPDNILLIYIPIVLTRAFGIARPGLHYAERLASHNFVLRMTSELRARLYRALEPDVLRKRNKHKTGDILSILADDIEHIQNLYLRIIFPSIVAALLYLAVVISLGAFSVTFALFMLLWVGIMVVLVPIVSLAVNGARCYRQKDMRSNLYQSLTDAILGVRDWLFSGRQSDFIKNYEMSADQLRASNAQSKRFSRRRDFMWQLLAAAALVAMLIWISNLTNQGSLSASWIAAFVLAVFPLADALAPIPEALSNLPNYQDSARRLDSLGRPTPPKTVAIPQELIRTPITIRLRDLHFHYEKENPILQGLSLTVSPGQKVAILGPSGSGKSTILGLIRGDLAPISGSALLNDIPSASIGDAVSSIIGVLNQHPYLFDTTISNNLRLGNPQASDTELEQAAAQAGLYDLIAALPSGMNTPMEEAGARFSGGERQRIALGRILLQKTPIVILDEPTIGLDPRQESELISSILNGLKDRSIIWVTHHLRGMERMDSIIFLENGRVALKGTHKELLHSSRRYQNLYAMDSLEEHTPDKAPLWH